MGEHLPCKQGVKGSNPFISRSFEEEDAAMTKAGAGNLFTSGGFWKS